MPAAVQRMELSAERLRSLSAQSRYVFALTSHIYNELMLPMKWLHVSRRPPGNPGPQEDAAVGISMFLLRLLSSKVYEALHEDTLRKNAVEAALRADYFAQVDGLNAQWDAVLAQHDALGWLGWIRNKGGFHYMNVNQWGPHLGDEVCEDATVYVGKRYADTYFHWSEMTAALPAMRQVNTDDPFAGLEQMLDELGNLLAGITDCLAKGLQAFIRCNDLVGSLSPAIRFDAPAFEPPALHYFFADPRIPV